MTHAIRAAATLLLIQASLVAGADASTNTPPSGSSNIQPAPGRTVAKPPVTRPPVKTPPPTVDPLIALKKRITQLEQQVARLNGLYHTLRKQAVTPNYVWQTAAAVVNRAFGKTAANTTRVPLSASTGGVKLLHIITGKDTAAGQAVGASGVRCSIVAWGGKAGSRGYLYVYAVPVGDMIMRNNYLIHADTNVPCIDGRLQTHHIWKGTTVKGAKMAPGRYKIFVRLIVYASNGKRIGQAMRFWGDARPTAYNLTL